MSGDLSKSIATFALAFLAGIVGAVFGWIVTGFAADAILAVTGMSDINGGRAMVAFFSFAPFGAIAGFIFGIWLVLHHRLGNPGFARVTGYSALVRSCFAPGWAGPMSATSISPTTCWCETGHRRI